VLALADSPTTHLLTLLQLPAHVLLQALVEVHDGDISGVKEQQKARLVRVHLRVHDELDERDDANAVAHTVARERPPRDLEVRAHESAGGDDEEDVEDGGADDGAEADVGFGHEDAHYGGEELGGGAAGGHEGGAGDVLLEVE